MGQKQALILLFCVNCDTFFQFDVSSQLYDSHCQNTPDVHINIKYR